MAETDDKARVFRALDRMRADGASDEQMRSFVQFAKSKQAKPAPDPPRLNPHTGMRLDTSPDEVTGADMLGVDDIKPTMGMNAAATFFPEDTQLHGLTPEQRRERLGDRAADAAGAVVGTATGGLAPAATVAGRLMAAAAAGGAGGLASGGTRKAIAGRSPEDLQQGLSPGEAIAKSASDEGMVGAGLGAGLHGAGELAGAAPKAWRKGGAWLARYLRANDAGVYESPEMKPLLSGEKAGPQGVNEAAYQGHKDISSKMQQERADLYAQHAAALNPPGPKPGQPLTREQIALEGAPDRPDQEALLAAAKGVDIAGEAPPPPLKPPTARESLLGAYKTRVAADRAAAAAPPPPTARESLLAAARKVDTAGVKPPPVDVPGEPIKSGGYKPKPSPEEPWPAEGIDLPADKEAVIRVLRAQQAVNVSKSTGRPFNPEVHDAFERTIADLGGEEVPVDVKHLLGQRHALGEQADFGNPNATTVAKANRKAYHALRGGIREAAPDTIAPADDVVSAGLTKAKRGRQLLYKSDAEVLPPQGQEPAPGGAAEPADELYAPADTSPDAAQMDVLKEQQGVRNLERIGDTHSKPGREAQRYLEELAAQNPEYAAALDFIGARSGYEATRFSGHMPSHFSGATALAGIPRFLAQKGNFAKGRILDPALRGLSSLKLTAPFSGSGADMLFRAQEASREREREDARRHAGHLREGQRK